MQESVGNRRRIKRQVTPRSFEAFIDDSAEPLRELLQPLALGVVLTLQALKVRANLRQLQLQLRVTAVGV